MVVNRDLYSFRRVCCLVVRCEGGTSSIFRAVWWRLYVGLQFLTFRVNVVTICGVFRYFGGRAKFGCPCYGIGSIPWLVSIVNCGTVFLRGMAGMF